MKNASIIISLLTPILLSGCSAIGFSWEGAEQTKQVPGNKCSVKLNNKKTYWSRFEGGAIYLYDRTGNSCLLKVIEPQSH